MREFTLSRRGVLGGAALLAAPAIIRPARAAEQCVVGTWGGDYARLLRENIDDPILKPAGIEVVQDIGDETPARRPSCTRSASCRAARMDIACLGASNGYRVDRGGLVEELDRDEGAEPEARASKTCACRRFVPHIYSAQVLVYNPDDGEPIRRRRFGDLLDPKWKGKIGMVTTAGSLGDDGGEPVRERQHHRLRQGQGVDAEAERQWPAAVSGDRRRWRRRSSRARSRSA